MATIQQVKNLLKKFIACINFIIFKHNWYYGGQLENLLIQLAVVLRGSY